MDEPVGEMCSLCMGDMADRDPRMLSCAHSFCLACLQDFRVGIERCPVCRKDFNPPIARVDLLPKNFWLAALTQTKRQYQQECVWVQKITISSFLRSFICALSRPSAGSCFSASVDSTRCTHSLTHLLARLTRVRAELQAAQSAHQVALAEEQASRASNQARLAAHARCVLLGLL
jgi:hypothetical protein